MLLTWLLKSRMKDSCAPKLARGRHGKPEAATHRTVLWSRTVPLSGCVHNKQCA